MAIHTHTPHHLLRWLLIGAAFAAAFFGFQSRVGGQEVSEEQPTFAERLIPLSTVPHDWSMVTDSAVASPDSRRVAFRVGKTRGGQAQAVMLDGDMGRKSPTLYGPVFSPDSSTVGIVHTAGDQGVLEVDNRVLTVQEPVAPVIFSPDSKRTAFIAREGTQRFVVVDAKRQLVVYDEVPPEMITFSPDSKHIAFVARRGRAWFVVVNGQEGEAYSIASHPVFSPDSQRLAYWVQKSSGQWVVVVDGQEDLLAIGDAPGGLVFSPDSSMLTAVVKRNKRWHVVINNRFEPGYEAIGPDGVVFSPDSSHLAYTVKHEGRWRVVLNGKLLAGQFDAIMPCSLMFSPDSGRLAYAAQGRGGWAMIVDEIPHQTYAWVYAESMRFSPNSNRFAYVAGTSSGKAVVVVDGQRWGVCHGVEDLAFSPDSYSVLWVQRLGRRSRMVVDGGWGVEVFDGLVPGASIVFDSPTRFHTVVSKRPGPVYFRLEGDLKTDPLPSVPAPPHSVTSY